MKISQSLKILATISLLSGCVTLNNYSPPECTDIIQQFVVLQPGDLGVQYGQVSDYEYGFAVTNVNGHNRLLLITQEQGFTIDQLEEAGYYYRCSDTKQDTVYRYQQFELQGGEYAQEGTTK